MTKICFHCKEAIDISLFYKNKNTKDGLTSVCKECNKIQAKENKTNPEKIIFSAITRSKITENKILEKEGMRLCKRKVCDNVVNINTQLCSKCKKDDNKRNVNKEIQKKHRKKYIEKNKEKISKYQKEYRAKSKNKTTA